MEVKDSKYLKGNNALKPKRKITVPKKNDDLKKLKKLKKDRQNNKEKKVKRSFSLIIAMIFVLGIGVIWRDANVFSLQNKLTDINKEIKQINVDNEALKVDLLKKSSIETVKNVAESNLKMLMPTKDQVIKIPDKDNIQIPKEKANEEQNKSFFNKIKDALK